MYWYWNIEWTQVMITSIQEFVNKKAKGMRGEKMLNYHWENQIREEEINR